MEEFVFCGGGAGNHTHAGMLLRLLGTLHFDDDCSNRIPRARPLLIPLKEKIPEISHSETFRQALY